MLEIVVILLIVNVISIAITINVLLYNIKGLEFLEYVKGVLSENDETEELETLTKEDIPLLYDSLLGLKGMIYFAFLTIVVNFVVILFVLFPELYVTTAWTVMMWVGAMMNATVILSFSSFAYTKAQINAICEAYNVLLESYKHMEEYEEKNNDSSDKF